jgi:hypothetical protein
MNDETRTIDMNTEDMSMGETNTGETPTSGRHPVNIGQLVMGIAFAGIVAIWMMAQAGVVGGDDYRWLLPIPWLAAGAAGLVASVLPSRRRTPAA